MKNVKVFIGRFQPFHNGHLKVLRQAIRTSDLVVVVIGGASNDHVPTLTNPWNHFERRAMIRYALTPAELKKVAILDQADLPGQDKNWVKAVKRQVWDLAKTGFPPGNKFKYTLVGCDKGADTYYLKLYRGWGLDLIAFNEAINARDIRAAYFSDSLTRTSEWDSQIPGSSAAYLYAWRRLACNRQGWIFHRLSREFYRETNHEQ